MATSSPQPGSAPRPQLLLIEDDEGVRRSLQLLLHWRGYDVRAFGAMAPAARAVQESHFDVMVSDFRLPDGDGIGALRALKRVGWAGRAILITGYPSRELCNCAAACGYHAVLEKPLREAELVAALSE